MDKEASIYVAGHKGLLGSALIRRLRMDGFKNIITRTHTELDLTRQLETEKFFAKEKPDYVFLAAAKAGGVYANSVYPANFMYDNLGIELNVIKAAVEHAAKKLLFVASTSVYPKDAPQPLSEEFIMNGELEPSNAAYALAKIIGLKLCEYCNKQYATNFISVIPTNLYGIGDSYHPQNAHVVPALIRKFSEAIDGNFDRVEIWGSGKARRELLNADDLADACVFLMNTYESEPLNVGTGTDLSIMELAEILKEVSGFKGELFFDPTKPEGIARRLTDSSKLFGLGWRPKVLLKEGLQIAYTDYRNSRKV